MAVLRTNLFQQAVIVSDAGSFAFLCRIVVLVIAIVQFVVTTGWPAVKIRIAAASPPGFFLVDHPIERAEGRFSVLWYFAFIAAGNELVSKCRLKIRVSFEPV
jgi:hypothetical protein